MKVLTTLALAAAASALAAPALAAHCSCTPSHAVHRHYIAPVRHHHARYIAPRTIVRTRTVYVTHYVNAPVYDDAPAPPPVYERERVRYGDSDRHEGRDCHHHRRHADRDWDDDRGDDGDGY